MEPETKIYERFVCPVCKEHRTHITGILCPTDMESERQINISLCPTSVEHGTDTCQWILSPTGMEHDHEIYQFSVFHKDGSWNSDI
jgi:hypothetical protein